ncbi:MAG: Wzz/FepE/Etk N-terminal domain-containing protein [Candidatus Kapaibacteriota bacterium]
MQEPIFQKRPTLSLDGAEFLGILSSKKWILFFLTVLSGLIAFGIAWTLPNWYASTVTFVPPNNANSMISGMMGNVSSALKDLGLGKMNKGESYSYMVILNSRSLMDTIINSYDLATEYQLPKEDREELYKEFLSNYEIELSPEGNYNVTILSKDKEKAAKMANDIVNIANNISLRMQKAEAETNRAYMDMRLKRTDSILNAIAQELGRFSSQSLVFSPLDQAQAVSEALATLKASALKQEIQVELLKNTYGEKDPSTMAGEKLLTEMKEQVYKAENKPGFAGNFALRDGLKVGAKYMKLYTEYEAMSKVKAFLMPMLEQAKLDEIREAPTMYVLDYAKPAFKKSRPKRLTITAGTALGVFVLSCLFLIISNQMRKAIAINAERSQVEAGANEA